MADAELKASRATTGLSAPEAAARLKAKGFNELPRVGRRSIARLILEVLREPMLALLLGGGAIYSSWRLKEAIILLAFALCPS